MTSYVLDTPEKIARFRLLTLRQALKLEIQGMRGRFNAYAIIKQETGLKGTRQAVFNQLSKLLDKETQSCV